MTTSAISKNDKLTKEVLADYHLAVASREASLMGRKEVFMGKAKFGIFGDGKEVAQIAMAKVFRKGDFRSGYYRDQTFMFAIDELSIQDYFAQLYAHTSIEADPASAGRLMNGHFATRLLDEQGNFISQTENFNSSGDISPTGGQMPRLLGLAWASKLYRHNKDLKKFKDFSIGGNEVAFGTIGNASTSEGMFLEVMNAAGVLQVPMIMSVWDDEYGISVPNQYHTTKGSISEALAGFQRTKKKEGFEILGVKGWDYKGLIDAYQQAENIARKEHVPVLIHVTEVTQPQGHSTSGSHERYKPKERLEWEREFDCIKKMRDWILENEIAGPEQLDTIENDAKEEAKNSKLAAWKAFNADILKAKDEVIDLLDNAFNSNPEIIRLSELRDELRSEKTPMKLDCLRTAKKALRALRHQKGETKEAREAIMSWIKLQEERHQADYSSHVYSESSSSALLVEPVKAEYDQSPSIVDGREVLLACFDSIFERDPRAIAFGEDVGQIGDVNQAFAGLQQKYGDIRITDTGIRETSIIGQGIGAALRGLRPIAEIQYLDYLVYALATLTDDLATLQYRTRGGQKAPLIIRTRGHRLEGVWHSGSPMGMILHSLRGIYVLVPRDMTKAAGFYNTIMNSDDTALIIECLNGYRLKEKLPSNIDKICEPLGVPEVIREGEDITVVTYGSMCRVVMEAASQLEQEGISVEIIDVQTLLPFDINHTILDSLKKTNRVVFADEDVPGGASAYMLQKVIEEQEGYKYLDSQPTTISAKEHRPAYGSDGDYFSKPNVEEVFERVYEIMAESDPAKYPDIY